MGVYCSCLQQTCRRKPSECNYFSFTTENSVKTEEEHPSIKEGSRLVSSGLMIVEKEVFFFILTMLLSIAAYKQGTLQAVYHKQNYS